MQVSVCVYVALLILGEREGEVSKTVACSGDQSGSL